MRTWDNPESFLNEIPNGWKHDRLKDVVSLREIRTDEKSDVEDYLELEDIESGTGQIISRRNTLGVESDVTCFRKGDVLFGKLRPYLEKYFLADFDGKCTGEILAFAPKRIEGHFLRYCVAAPWFIEKCNSLAYGAKMPRVNWAKQLALFDIPLPSREEQRRIVAYLDKACEAIDGAISAKRQQLEVLDNLRKSIIHKAVTHGLDVNVRFKPSGTLWFDLIPDHWSVDRVKDITSKIGSGITPEGGATVYVDDGIPLLRSQNIHFDGIRLDDVAYITPEQHLEMSGTHVRPGDVLLNITGASLGRCCCVPSTLKEANVNQHVCIIRLAEKKKMTSQFLYYFLASEAGQKQVWTGFRGASRQGLNYREIEGFVVPIPPLEKQGAICKTLDRQTHDIQELYRNLETQIATLEQYRKSLIHECVTGKWGIE